MFTVFFTPASGRNRAFPYSVSYSFYTAFAPIQLPHVVSRSCTPYSSIQPIQRCMAIHHTAAIQLIHHTASYTSPLMRWRRRPLRDGRQVMHLGLHALRSDSPRGVMRHLRVLALLAAELRWRMLLLSERSGSLVLRYHGNGHAGREASLGSRPRPRSGHRVLALGFTLYK